MIYDREENGQFAPKGTGDKTKGNVSPFERGLRKGFEVNKKRIDEIKKQLQSEIMDISYSKQLSLKRELEALEKGYSSADEMPKPKSQMLTIFSRWFDITKEIEVDDKIIDYLEKHDKFWDELKKENRFWYESRNGWMKMKSFYDDFQDGIADENNFYTDTMAEFKRLPKRPSRKPDYVSYNRDGKVSSEYWYTKDGVIRGSKHWGSGIASCDWLLEGLKGTDFIKTYSKMYGKCAWKDFTLKPHIEEKDGKGVLTTFKNYKNKQLV